MNRIPGLLILAAASLALPILRAAEPIELSVWSGEAPGSEGIATKETWEERGKNGVINRAVRQVHKPTIAVYLPEKGRATGVAVLLAPGGGYEHVTIDLEGNDVARWLTTQGIAGIVLKYRLPNTPGGKYTTETALADATQALKVVREHAAEWGIDPARLGMMGFSAGGNLTALAGTKLPKEQRPAFLGLMYSQIPETMAPTVPDDAPRAFIVQAFDDTLASENSIRFYTWLRAKKIPAELHLYASGGHGFGLGRAGTPTVSWPALFVSWLGANGFTGEVKK